MVQPGGFPCTRGVYMRVLFDGIPLDTVPAPMTINAPDAGTIQNDGLGEVVRTGLHRTPGQIVQIAQTVRTVRTALQEDAHAIGRSILSGAHPTLFPKVIALPRERDASGIVVFGGAE